MPYTFEEHRDTNRGVIKNIRGNNFYQIINILKRRNLRYVSAEKSWQGDLSDVKEAMGDIKLELGDKFKETEPKKIDYFKDTGKEFDTNFTIRFPFDKSQIKSDFMGDYQKEGVRKGLRQNRLFLAWEMGLGKSFVVLTILNHYFKAGVLNKLIVVAPIESIYNFRREILKFSTFCKNQDEIYIVDTKNRKPFQSDAKVILCTYSSFLFMTRDKISELGMNKIKRASDMKTGILKADIQGWGGDKIGIVLDESHYIKNNTSQRSKILLQHKECFVNRYLLTGTPDPRSVEGWYNQIKFLDDKVMPYSYSEWLNRVAKIGTSYSDYAVKYFIPDRVERYMECIGSLISREFVKNNIELPPQYIKDTYIPLSSTQLKIYQSVITHYMKKSSDKSGYVNTASMFGYLGTIQTALDNPAMLRDKIDTPEVRTWRFENHSKLPILDSLLQASIKRDGKKVILWSGHPATMDYLATRYEKYKPVVIHGAMKSKKGQSVSSMRDDILTQFRSKKSCKLLIASYMVLSTAVNIVEAEVAIYFDRSYNSSYWIQSLARIHRLGQTKKTIVYPLIFENTIEEQIDRSLKRKCKLNELITKRKSMTMLEWKSLFLGEKVDR